jgi:hypothetical protein
VRQRETINVWPAIADLMTILAVPCIVVSVGLFPFSHLEGSRPGGDSIDTPSTKRSEEPKNVRMFKAIQRAEDFVKEVRGLSGLKLDADQSLRFGDDLVEFRLNSFEPIWKGDARRRLQTYCASIAAAVRRQPAMEDRFILFVEGHTDSSTCPGDPDCNWWVSANRAAAFVVTMRRPEICPGGAHWTMLPTGLAATHPIAHGSTDRRIALHLVPNYQRIIDDVMKDEPGRASRPR